MRRTRCLSFNVALNAKTDIANANQTGSCQPFPVVIDLLSSSIRTARLSEVLFPVFEIPSW